MPCCRNGSGCPQSGIRARCRGFTVIELVVVLGVAVLLVGLLIPALSASRERARAIDCATHIQQLGIAINLYMNDSAGCLPQVLRPESPGGAARLAPLLFGGKKGTLAQDGIDQMGIGERPLNRYAIGSSAATGDASASAINVFRSPADSGGTLPADEGGPVASMFDRVGTSYILNDRLLRATSSDAVVPTLIPITGGPLPKISTPERTWMLGSHPIRNYDTGVDRRMFWYGEKRVRVNLLMADMHVGSLLEVPAGAVQSTDRYTFLPSPGWPGN